MKKLVFTLPIIIIGLILIFSCQKESGLLNFNNETNSQIELRDDDVYAQMCTYDGNKILVNQSKFIKPASLTGVGWTKLATNWNYDTVYLEWGDYSIYGTLDIDSIGANTQVIYGLYYPLDPNLPANGPAYLGSVISTRSIEFVNVKINSFNLITGWNSGVPEAYFNCCEFTGQVYVACPESTGSDACPYSQFFSCEFHGGDANLRSGNFLAKNTVFDGCDIAITLAEQEIQSAGTVSRIEMDSCVFKNNGEVLNDDYVNTSWYGYYLYPPTSNSSFLTNPVGFNFDGHCDNVSGFWYKCTFLQPDGVSTDYTGIYANEQYPGYWNNGSIDECNFLNFNDKKPVYYTGSSNTTRAVTDSKFSDCDSGVYNNWSCSGNTHRSSNANCSSTQAGSAFTVYYHTNTTLLNWATSSYTSQ